MGAEDESRGAEDVYTDLCAAQTDVSPCASLARAKGAPASPISLAPEIESLLRRWQTALPAGPHALPPFEELAIGSLGRMADAVALLREDSSEALTLLRAGGTFTAWIEAPNSTLEITPRSTGRARVVYEAVTEALAEFRPVHKVTHALVHFVLRSDDLVALPLSNPWGPPLCLVYVCEREPTCNLLESMFQASAEGLVALVVIRGRSGEPRDFQILTLNNGAATLLQRPAAELTGHRLSEAAISLGERTVISRLLDVLATGENARFELDQPTANGEVVHLNVGAAPMGDFVALTLSNIGDVKRREASFRLLFKENPVPMWLCDSTDDNILAVNEAAISHYGYDRPTFLSKRVRDIIASDAEQNFHAIGEAGKEQAKFERVTRHVKADGSVIDVHIYGRGVTLDGVAANLVTIVDITEQKRAEARIEHIAHHDGLTDLPNRVLFSQELSRALIDTVAGGKSLAVLYLDLDRFKDVNDTLGHQIGDQLLCAVAERLRKVLRRTDVVARIGGDEFAIIQQHLETPELAGHLAWRIVEALNVPFDIDHHHVMIGVSIGIALAPANGDEAHVLLRNADIALYRAKEEGRCTFLYFSSDMDARVLARRSLESTLVEAYAKEEFELYYQPLVDLKSGAISGFEALLRWNHPSRGLVAPGEFIPLAEKSGLIVPLGEWVLRRACVEAASWPDPLKVTVNLSAVQFKFGNLHKTVLQALVDSGLAPYRLDLEITETVVLAESDSVLETLHRLRDLGVGVSMDDFGTGYSCLTYLRTFPFTKIKIDKSFVDEIAFGEPCTAIVRAVAALGTSLGMSITAEGVETREQLDWLQQEGCTEIQGYYFSPPVPAREISGLLAKQTFSLDARDASKDTDRAA